jgi:hypothetical protein
LKSGEFPVADAVKHATQVELIRRFCATLAGAVLFDEPGSMLLDVYSNKMLSLDLPELQGVEERRNRQTHKPYLLLIYGDQRQIALADVGIAFSPQFRNTGPLPDLPEVVCFRDFRALLDRFKHGFYGHAENDPGGDLVQLLMMCIAILDGARDQGFDVEREEKEVELHLSELEKRTSGSS